MLEERIRTYKSLKNNKLELYKYKYKTEKQYKEEFEFLKEVDSTAIQQARMDLSTAYSNFFRSLKNSKRVGYPKFKKKGGPNSYRCKMNCAINHGNKTIKILKVGNIKFRHRNIKDWYLTAKVKSITISKTATGKYYASVLFEGDNLNCRHVATDKVIGLDCSLDKFYVDNLGNSPAYRRIYRQNESKLSKLQRSYSRKVLGSSNRKKAGIRVAKLNEKIKRKRLDFIEKLSLDLVKENDVIVVENLSLSGMKKALNLGKSITDLGYSMFINKLQYKSTWNNKTLIKAHRYFSSSKTCSCCGYLNRDLMLQERTWTCPVCGSHLNRDQNAGQNLQTLGLIAIGQGLPKSTLAENKTTTTEKYVASHDSVKQEISLGGYST